LFTIGAAFAMLAAAHGGSLPRARWAVYLCAVYLGLAFLESTPWEYWHLPSLRPFNMAAPDKTQLAAVRILNVLALAYPLLSSPGLHALAGRRFFRPLEACGRHSLEVFAAGCICALFGRLLFRTYGAGFDIQVAINVIGLALMCMLGLWLERRRMQVGGKAGTATLEVRPTGRRTLEGGAPQPADALVVMTRAQVNDVANKVFRHETIV
jgi:hypothetical protein